MTDKEFLEYHHSFTEKMREIVRKKNHDYAGFGESAFANFELVEKIGIAKTEQGFLTRIVDKISRINSFIEQGTTKVEDEKIEDTLMDLANYSILLAGYLKSKKLTTEGAWSEWERTNTLI